jgi:hypothetical protein
LWSGGCRFRSFGLLALFALGGWIGVGAGLAVEVEFAAICDDKRLVLFWHSVLFLSDADGRCHAAAAE